MKNNFLLGMKNDTHYLLKQLLIVILIWIGICSILIKGLFGYYENFVQRRDAKIIYEIEPTTVRLEASVDGQK